jgi:hypothetical protein
MNNNAKLEISKKMDIQISKVIANYKLKGIVYLGNFHFTCRLITSNDRVWFHDGRITARRCCEEGHFSNFSNTDLLTCDEKNAMLAVYIHKNI